MNFADSLPVQEYKKWTFCLSEEKKSPLIRWIFGEGEMKKQIEQSDLLTHTLKCKTSWDWAVMQPKLLLCEAPKGTLGCRNASKIRVCCSEANLTVLCECTILCSGLIDISTCSRRIRVQCVLNLCCVFATVSSSEADLYNPKGSVLSPLCWLLDLPVFWTVTSRTPSMYNSASIDPNLGVMSLLSPINPE